MCTIIMQLLHCVDEKRIIPNYVVNLIHYVIKNNVQYNIVRPGRLYFRRFVNIYVV